MTETVIESVHYEHDGIEKMTAIITMKDGYIVRGEHIVGSDDTPQDAMDKARAVAIEKYKNEMEGI